MESPLSTDRPGNLVTVVGAGIAGAACAVALRAAGVPVRLVDRGRAVGGRMASPVLHDRRVDLGAGYFTVKDEGFAEVVAGWEQAGLARPWTDTFTALAPGVDPSTKSGPVRWGTPGGLRSLVWSMLAGAGIEVEAGVELEALPDGPVVLAMPDPQAQRVFAAPELRFVDYEPVIAVACGFDERCWPALHDAAFEHDDTFHLHLGGSAPVGLAGDQWCPQGAPRVESAWRSGTDVAGAVVATL